MRRSRLFASILGGLAALAGSTYTPEPTTITPAQYAKLANGPDSQVTGTKSPLSSPLANVSSQLVRAGATVVPIPVRFTGTPRWAWVGRKVNGKFGYYCRRVGA